MSHYRKVDVRIWNDAKFMSMDDDGRMVFLFLLTHPHMTSVGAMRGTVAGLASELGWKLSRMKSSTDLIENLDMIQIESRSSIIWLPNFIRYNSPESPNVVCAWRKSLDLLPEGKMINSIVNHIESELSQLGSAFVDAWVHGKNLHKGSPSADVIKQVRDRDGSICRYCSVTVNWKDRKGKKGGTYDHVNPRGESTFDNIVVCCRSCNGKKGVRTPDQAGMPLNNLKSQSNKPRSDLDPTRVSVGNQEQEQEHKQEQDVKKHLSGDTPPTTTSPPKPKKSRAIAPGHQQVIAHFKERFESFSGNKWHIDGGKVGSCVQRLMKTYAADEICQLINIFFEQDDAFLAEVGRDFGIFYSQVNKLQSRKDYHGKNRKSSTGLAAFAEHLQREARRKQPDHNQGSFIIPE